MLLAGYRLVSRMKMLLFSEPITTIQLKSEIFAPFRAKDPMGARASFP